MFQDEIRLDQFSEIFNFKILCFCVVLEIYYVRFFNLW